MTENIDDEEKPYLLFTGDRYYPSGGWEDYKGRYSSLVECEARFKELYESDNTWKDGYWGQAVSLENMEIVWEY